LLARAIAGDRQAQAAIDIEVDAAVARRDFAAVDEVLRPLAVAARDDQTALEFLLGLLDNHGIVVATVAKHVRDERIREEACQDALWSIAKNIGQYEGRSRFTSWVYPIAANAGRMATRSASRRPQDSGAPVPELDPSLRRMSSVIVSRDAVREAVSSLPEHYRIPFELREYDGHSYEAIAVQLDVSIGTVKSRLSRAREDLSRKLLGHR
jgi:RNA polymerase sigma factor (sigma-70 family)